MTRRLVERPPRRPQRVRPMPHRPEHGFDLAPAVLRPEPHTDPAQAQRADHRALRALADENALLARELGRVQARCTRWRDDCISQAERLEGQLMRARGENIAKETHIAALRDALDALEQRAAAWPSQEDLVRRIADLRSRNTALEAELHALRGERVDPAPAGATTQLGARHVLCVGGRARQIPVYRELVERGGARFDHVDGAEPSCLPRLRLSLADADLVILQPGFVCQGACRAVEQHCARAGVRCVQLDKACALGFARSLADAARHPDQRESGAPPPAR
jgi:Uncharacterized protein conserved in bacteria (DUF2325)